MAVEEKRAVPTRPPQPRELPGLLSDIGIPGFVAGTVGGVLMGLVAIGASALFAHRPLEPLQLVAGLFLRDARPAALGPWAAVLGAAIHLGVATGLGVAFAFLVPRGGTAVATLGWAWLFAMGLYVVMNEIVVQFADPLLYRHLPPLPFFGLHLLFGVSLTLVTPVRRLLRRLLNLREKVRDWLEAPARA